MSNKQKDIRALFVSYASENLSGSGQAEIKIQVSAPIIGVSQDPKVIVDLETSHWATNRKASHVGSARGEILEIGQCGTGVCEDECFAVIDMNDDSHLQNVANYFGNALIGQLKMVRKL